MIIILLLVPVVIFILNIFMTSLIQKQSNYKSSSLYQLSSPLFHLSLSCLSTIKLLKVNSKSLNCSSKSQFLRSNSCLAKLSNSTIRYKSEMRIMKLMKSLTYWIWIMKKMKVWLRNSVGQKKERSLSTNQKTKNYSTLSLYSPSSYWNHTLLLIIWLVNLDRIVYHN